MEDYEKKYGGHPGFPSGIYIEIKPTEVVSSLRVDIYEKLEIGDCESVKHVRQVGYFFVRDLKEDTVSGLIKKVTETITEIFITPET